MSAIQYAFKTFIMQSKFSSPNLDFALIPQNKRISIHEEFSYFHDNGLDAILNTLNHRNYIEETQESIEMKQKHMIMDHAVELKGNLLYYLPGTYKNNEEIYEYNLYSNMDQLFQIINRVSELTFIECNGKKSIVSSKILKEADLVVVNLPQNPANFLKILKSSELQTEKVVFLIGQYNEDSKYHFHNIRRKFHIQKENIGVIPYNIDFMDSLIGGRTIDFLERNRDCRKQDYNYYFMEELRASTNMILKKVGIHVS